MNFRNFICFVAFAALSLTSYSQVFNYNDLGILFSSDAKKATARFNAMSGAFGALGGDISSTTINPAGASVAKLSSISVTGTHNSFNDSANYYGTSSQFESSNFRIPQLGALFVFKSNKKSDWNKSAIFFNFRNKSNFNLNYDVEGNSNLLFYTEHPSDISGALFDRSLNQFVSNSVSGRSDVFDLGFSTVHKNKLHLGAALKFHQVEFIQETVFNEVNDDIDGNILDVQEYTLTDISGAGVSLSLGFIYKLNQYLRFGLSYETPTYYSRLFEDYYDELDILSIQNLGIPSFFESNGPDGFVHRFRTPSVITASGALVFGKRGLVSADFTHRDYTNINFSGSDFNDVNNSFTNDYRDTYSLNVGAEWRFDNNFSIRGGASYQKDPNLTIGGNTNDDNIKGFSLGAGYNFGKSSFDISFNNSENRNYYTIYNTGDLSVDRTITQISGTFTINL